MRAQRVKTAAGRSRDARHCARFMAGISRSGLIIRRLNLAGTLDWDPASPVVQFTNIALDGPNSRARASGRVLWNRSAEKSPGRLQQPEEIALSSARVDMGDVLAWFRAFHTGIADNLSVHGNAQVQAKFAGWPPHVVNAEAETDAIEVGAAGVPRSARLDPVTFRFVRGKAAAFAANLVGTFAGSRRRIPAGGVVPAHSSRLGCLALRRKSGPDARSGGRSKRPWLEHFARLGFVRPIRLRSAVD